MRLEENTIPAGKFKAQCLAILDEVQESGKPVIVTKRGKPVAKVVPYSDKKAESLRGSVTFHGDVVGPILDEWDADQFSLPFGKDLRTSGADSQRIQSG